MMGKLCLLGVSHKSAPVEERERLAVPEASLPDLMREMVALPSVREVAVVSTCNRVEFVALADEPEAVEGFIKQRFGLTDEWMARHAYEYGGRDALTHLFRVTSALDSLVLGESQILGQVKDSLSMGLSSGATGTVIGRVFSHAIRTAKRVRTETGISESAVSISYAAVELARKVFGRIDGRRVLVIGAGKMGALAAKQLVQAGAGQVDICNRSVERAQALAAELGGKAHGFEALGQLLEEADIVISSTGAAGFVVKAELVREVVVRRKYRPLFFIDIAVPRDIDPACDQLQNVYVFDIDDLEKVVDANLSTRRAEAIAGERIVTEEVAQMERWFAEHSVVPTIVELRNHFNATKESEVERILRAHPSLPPEQRELLHRFGNQLIAKLLHGPTVALRSSTASASDQQLMMATSRLFGLHDPGDALPAVAAPEGEQEG